MLAWGWGAEWAGQVKGGPVQGLLKARELPVFLEAIKATVETVNENRTIPESPHVL